MPEPVQAYSLALAPIGARSDDAGDQAPINGSKTMA
jgi:hypothetical protein